MLIIQVDKFEYFISKHKFCDTIVIPEWITSKTLSSKSEKSKEVSKSF